MQMDIESSENGPSGKLWVCEIAASGMGDAAETLRDRLIETLRGECGSELAALDLYLPAEAGEDPYKPRETPPDFLLLAGFETEAALKAVLAADAMSKALDDLPEGAEVTATPMERLYYPVPDGPGMPLEAPVSYVVRYRRPAEDEAAFVENYIDTHPQTQAKLPGIRSILCYMPVGGTAHPGVPPADYMVGNEVAFDSEADFNAAMQSETRHELRAHFNEFPAFSGETSHVLMHRRTLPVT